MKTFIWDEISNEVAEKHGLDPHPDEWDEGWIEQHRTDDIREWRSDRNHVAFELDAESKEAAHQRLMKERPYREMQPE